MWIAVIDVFAIIAYLTVRRHKKNVHGIGEDGVVPDGEAEVDSKLFFTHQQMEEEEQRLSQEELQQEQQTSTLQQQQLKTGDPVSGSSEMDMSSALVKVQSDGEIIENVTIQFDEKGQKSYKCDICEKVLQSKYNLKRHNVSRELIEPQVGCI